MDILLQYDNTTQTFDFPLDVSQQTKDLETLVQVAIFTDRNSWWGDSSIGSDLYKLSGNYADIAKDYVNNCLLFLTDYNLCKSYDVRTEYSSGNLSISISVIYNTGISKMYEYVWEDI